MNTTPSKSKVKTKPIKVYYVVEPSDLGIPDLYQVGKCDIETGECMETYLVSYDPARPLESTCDCMGFQMRVGSPSKHKHVLLVKAYLKHKGPQSVGYIILDPKLGIIRPITLY